MKERIEKKIKDCVESILRKEHIDFADYQTLTAELGRIKADEAAKKFESESEERNARMAQLMAYTFTK